MRACSVERAGDLVGEVGKHGAYLGDVSLRGHVEGGGGGGCRHLLEANMGEIGDVRVVRRVNARCTEPVELAEE